MYEYFL